MNPHQIVFNREGSEKCSKHTFNASEALLKKGFENHYSSLWHIWNVFFWELKLFIMHYLEKALHWEIEHLQCKLEERSNINVVWEEVQVCCNPNWKLAISSLHSFKRLNFILPGCNFSFPSIILHQKEKLALIWEKPSLSCSAVQSHCLLYYHRCMGNPLPSLKYVEI